jgi:hypothetical protein
MKTDKRRVLDLLLLRLRGKHILLASRQLRDTLDYPPNVLGIIERRSQRLGSGRGAGTGYETPKLL